MKDIKKIKVSEFRFEMLGKVHTGVDFIAMNRDGKWFVSSCGMRSYYGNNKWGDDCNFGRVVEMDVNKLGFDIERIDSEIPCDYKNTVLMKRDIDRYWDNRGHFRDLYAEMHNPIVYPKYDTKRNKFDWTMPENFFFDDIKRRVYQFEFQTDSRWFSDMLVVERLAKKYGFKLKPSYKRNGAYLGVIEWWEYDNEDTAILKTNIKEGQLFQDRQYDNCEDTWFIRIGSETFMFVYGDNYYEKFFFYDLSKFGTDEQNEEISCTDIAKKLRKSKGVWSFVNVDFDLKPYEDFMEALGDDLTDKYVTCPFSAIQRKNHSTIVVFLELKTYLLNKTQLLPNGYRALKQKMLSQINDMYKIIKTTVK